MDILHFVCLHCNQQYKTLAVERDLGALDISHGVCPECAKKMDAKLFGRVAAGAAAMARVGEEVEALR